MEAAAEDIRDVMITYTSCTDPSESAARKERLRQAAALGHLEKSAIRAEGVRAARKETEEHPTDTEERASQERVPISTRLGVRDINEGSGSARVRDDIQGSEERVRVGEQDSQYRAPILSRLGPLNYDINDASNSGNLPSSEG